MIWRKRSLAVVAIAATASGPARAADDDPLTEDGFAACARFEAQAERELDAWAREQPRVPFRPEREETLLGAPWTELLRALGRSGPLLAATFIPAVGAQSRASAPAMTLSFPWSLPVGPALACSRARGSFAVKKHVPNRLLLEPAIVPIGGSTVAMWIRPGYRLLVHPSTWALGLGGGVGTTVDLFGFKGEPSLRPSLSPEIVLHLGHCCDRGYFLLAVRGDVYFAGKDRFVFGANVGYTYF